MRVVFVTHNYPRSAGDVAGAFLHPLALALRERDVDVRVIAPSDRGKGGDDILDGIPVKRVRYAGAEQETFAYSGTMSEAVKSPRGLRALASMIASLRKEARSAVGMSRDTVVHAHWWVPAGVAVPSAVRSVVTCHGTDVRLLAKGGPFQWIGRRVLRRARVVTTVSRPFAEMITARTGVAMPDDTIQPMPVLRIERPLSSGGGGFVVIGRLTPQKRVELAVRAYAVFRDRGTSLPLTIVGDGVAMSSLVELVASLGIRAHVKFSGALAPAAIPAALSTADGLLMTAQEEGLGLVAAEALMQGVPVIACTDGGGVLDIVPSDGGGRVVPPDAFAIAGAMESILSDAGARGAAARLGEAWAAKLSPAVVADRAIGWYQRALDA